MARTKATVRRLPQVVIQQRIGNKNILNRRIRNISFKKTDIATIKKGRSQIKKMNRQLGE